MHRRPDVIANGIFEGKGFTIQSMSNSLKKITCLINHVTQMRSRDALTAEDSDGSNRIAFLVLDIVEIEP